MSVVKALLGWTPCDFETYCNVFYRYGGSVNMHPDVIHFFMKKDVGFTFWKYEKNEEIIAAYFTADANKIGMDIWRDYPVSYDEIIIPIVHGQKIILPEKCNRLSPVLRDKIRNSSYSFRGRRKICTVKSSFSAKTVKKRRGELKRLLDAGGRVFQFE